MTDTIFTRPVTAARTEAPRRGSLRALALSAAGSVAEIWRRHHNRRAIRKLMALDRDALKDIGLSRSDVAGALALPLSKDPSRHLADALAERRRAERLARLCR